MKTEMQDKESLGRDGEGGFWRSKYQKVKVNNRKSLYSI